MIPPFKIIVLQEEFDVDWEDGFYITHPRWSTVGFGQTVIEAERDLINEAIEVRECFPLSELHRCDESAKDMTIWMHSIVVK
jgi:hypothetical protein